MLLIHGLLHGYIHQVGVFKDDGLYGLCQALSRTSQLFFVSLLHLVQFILSYDEFRRFYPFILRGLKLLLIQELLHGLVIGIRLIGPSKLCQQRLNTFIIVLDNLTFPLQGNVLNFLLESGFVLRFKFKVCFPAQFFTGRCNPD